METSIKNFAESVADRLRQAQIDKYGHVLTDSEVDAIRMREEQQHKQAAARLNVDKWMSQIPPRFVGATFESFENVSPKIGRVIQYLKSGMSAVITGKNGTGKTHLGYASCLYQAQRGKSVMYVLAFDYFNEIRMSFDGGDAKRIVEKYARYDYLVIDEVDKVHGTQNEFVYLYKLVNTRYENMLPTVVIANANQTELSNIIGKSTYDRIASEGIVIEADWDNYRQKSGARRFASK